MEKEEATKNQRKEFKIGDRVYAPFRGCGTITEIRKDKCVYPIIVKWDDSDLRYVEEGSSFTEDGYLTVYNKTDELRITVVEDKENEGMEEEETNFKEGEWDHNPFMMTPAPLASAINHNIDNKEDKKVDTKSEKFKVGDMVWSFYFGVGTVIEVQASNHFYQVLVRWSEHAKQPGLYDYFLLDGRWCDAPDDEEKGIVAFEVIDWSELSDLSDDSGVVDRMMDALNKKTEDAINPSHYKVKGLSEAYEIINHLMHREQYEGFLWGNIIKYAYRYGRKGDKAETAGKIEWYAKKLKELEEEKRK